MKEKNCPRCGIVKPISEYGKNKRDKHGLSFWCLVCKRAYDRDVYSKRPEAKKAKPAVQRRTHLKIQYGVTPEEWDWLYAGQNGQCAICGDDILQIGVREQTPGRKAAVTDHCHETGVVRGLLCSPCNTGIGYLRDDPSIIISAYAYLNFFRELSHAPDVRVGPRDERTS